MLIEAIATAETPMDFTDWYLIRNALHYVMVKMTNIVEEPIGTLFTRFIVINYKQIFIFYYD